MSGPMARRASPGAEGAYMATLTASAILSKKEIKTMTNYQLYVRMLTELHHTRRGRLTSTTRLGLQDVLIELRDRAAAERGDSSGQRTQDDAETDAYYAVKEGKDATDSL